MLQITVNSKSVVDGLSKLIKNLEFTKPLKEAKKTLDTETRRNFDLQGYIYDSKGFWTSLAPSTVRERGGSARPILVRTGKLKRSFSGEVRGDILTYKNTSEIAKYHQFGTRRMIARPILGISSKFRIAVTKMIANYIADTIRKSYG